jgi:type II secretory pathway component PulF
MHIFHYRAVGPDDRPVRGSIEAGSRDVAMSRLAAMHLRNITIEEDAPVRVRPLSGDDVLAFNEQIAQLARAGLPLEAGLDVLAKDLSRGPLRDATLALKKDLDRGVPLEQAVATRRDAFPAGYASLLDAGLKSGRLPDVLLTVGQHYRLMEKLKTELVRSLTYPLVMIVAVVGVAAFLSRAVLVPMVTLMERTLYGNRSPRLLGQPRQPLEVEVGPYITRAAIWFGEVAPWVLGAFVAVLLVAWIVWPRVRGQLWALQLRDACTRIPVIGRALRESLLARWAGVLWIAIDAGVDLPGAIRLAGDAVGSPALKRDGDTVINAIGIDPAHMSLKLKMLPHVVPASLLGASATGSLPDALAGLAAGYRTQAETRASRLPTLLLPFLLIVVALVVAGLVAAIFVPLGMMLRGLSGV